MKPPKRIHAAKVNGAEIGAETSAGFFMNPEIEKKKVNGGE
jgi:hypothetical protein